MICNHAFLLALSIIPFEKITYDARLCASLKAKEDRTNLGEVCKKKKKTQKYTNNHPIATLCNKSMDGLLV